MGLTRNDLLRRAAALAAAVRRELTPKRAAHGLTFAGAALASFGVGLIYAPAGVIVGGVALVAFAVLAIDVGDAP